MCGGLPLPPPCPRIYGFVKAWRGAEAGPAEGEFDVSLAAPAGFPPCAVEGEQGQAPRGCGDSGSRTEGREAWPPSLCCLAPEDFWVGSLQVTPSAARPRSTPVWSFSSPPAFTHAGSSAWSAQCSVRTPPILADLASVPPAVGGILVTSPPSRQFQAVSSGSRPCHSPYQPLSQPCGMCLQMPLA